MTARHAIVAVLAALLLIGVWTAFGDRGGVPSGTASSQGDPAADATTEADEAAAAEAEALDAPDGYAIVPYLVDAPVRAFDGPEPVLEEGRDYRARIETSAGTLTVDLYQAATPVTVESFVFLALHRFYEGVPFHRVLDDFMAQTGDPTGTGTGGPGYRFDDEIVDGLVHDRPGLLSMANSGPGTNGSQFFLTFVPTPWLDGAHTVFGEVLDGMEVLDALQRVDPQNPSVVAMLGDPVAVLEEQGVALDEGGAEAPEDPEATVGDWLEARLDHRPEVGASFQLGERRGMIGTVSGAPAVGLFGVPDRIERVTILIDDANGAPAGDDETPEGGDA